MLPQAATTRRRTVAAHSGASAPPRAPRAPPWRRRRRGECSAGFAPADAAADADAQATSLSALLAPLIARAATAQSPLPAAIFWDADNVRPSVASLEGGGGGGGRANRRRAAALRGLAALSAELARAGCRVDACAAYGNADTLGEEGDVEGEDEGLCRIVVTTTAKRQSADMALLSDLAAFVRRQQLRQQQLPQWREESQQQPQQQGQGQERCRPPRNKKISCLVLLIADDAGYAAPCAWASSPSGGSAAVVAVGASGGKRRRYAPRSGPAEPWRFHPVAKAGAAAVVVPWVAAVPAAAEEGEETWGRLDVELTWVDPSGAFGDGGGG